MFVDQLANDTIFRLQAIGLHGASAMSLSSEPEVRERLNRLISESDAAVKELRRALIALGQSGDTNGAAPHR